MRALSTALGFLTAIWFIFVADLFIPIDFSHYFGLTPRSLHGLFAIFTLPFVHKDLSHIMGNSFPLFILIFLLNATKGKDRAAEITVALIVLSGAILWLIGNAGTETVRMIHIGASGLIYALAAYLVTAGIYERKVIVVLTGILVFFSYGGLIWGVLPTSNGISWESHLGGLIAGISVGMSVESHSPTGSGTGFTPDSGFD